MAKWHLALLRFDVARTEKVNNERRNEREKIPSDYKSLLNILLSPVVFAVCHSICARTDYSVLLNFGIPKLYSNVHASDAKLIFFLNLLMSL